MQLRRPRECPVLALGSSTAPRLLRGAGARLPALLRWQALALLGTAPAVLVLDLPSPAGRVARAGRGGTAYSLVAPDELPYLLDLHLFLGRALALAQPHSEPAGEGPGGTEVLWPWRMQMGRVLAWEEAGGT